ncbi:MAG: hypothetical protein ACTHK1_01130 [Actinomycetales bacterium]
MSDRPSDSSAASGPAGGQGGGQGSGQGSARPRHERSDGRERCPQCGSLQLSVVDVTLSDGSPVSMVSCRQCEHRVWRRPDGELVDLQEVLDKAPRSRRRRPGT